MFIPHSALTLLMATVPISTGSTTQFYGQEQFHAPVVTATSYATSGDISQLSSEYDFAMTDGWDGEKATAISPKVISIIRELLSKSSLTLIRPEVTPLVRGGLNLLWEMGDKYIFLEVRNDGAVHLYYNFGGDRWEAVRPANDLELRMQLTKAAVCFWGINIVQLRPKTQNSFIFTV